MKHLVKQTIGDIKRIENMGPQWGVQVSALQLKAAGLTPDSFVRALFQNVDIPLTVTQRPESDDLTIEVDHEVMAREATKQ